MLPHPPPGPARRRLAAVGAAAVVALRLGVVGGAAGGSGGSGSSTEATKPPAKAVAKAKGLSLSRQVGEGLMIAFQGTPAPGYVQRALPHGRAAGVILSKTTARTPGVTPAL